MTTTKVPLTFETASADRDRLAAAARAAGEVADRLASERLAVLTERRGAWATAVLAESAAVGSALAEAEKAAARAFRAAAVSGDARPAYLEWIDARNESNLQRDRLTQARAILGREAQDDGGYPHRDVPSFSAELDRALSSEASGRWADRQSAFQREINSLDEMP